ncbi:hypothetical protein ACN47E_001184 [Coniothyrium glycines]
MIARPIRALQAARMISTLVGQSGRKYDVQKVIHPHRKTPSLSICLALCDQTPYVVKPVSESMLEHLHEFRAEFENHPRLRHHVDKIEKENILVYPYFKSDLLALVKNYPSLPMTARKMILKEIGDTLAEMHEKNWIHLDVKPDNIFVNWHLDANDEFHLDKVVLGDMDLALKLKGEKLLNHKLGNAMWRSPEGQLGRGVGKPSEVFSFALLCLYVITGVQAFHLDFPDWDAEPEVVVLVKFLLTFGPLPDALVKHVDDASARELLTDFWEAVKEADTNTDLAGWTEDEFPNLTDEAKRLILRMANLDPAMRASMSEIVKDSYWVSA